MSDWSKYAGMPFLEQDRPAKVKEIYSALKRDHPDMPAEMKARIAARQGKKGKQKQGPPYKGPLTKKGYMMVSVPLPSAEQRASAKPTVPGSTALGATTGGILGLTGGAMAAIPQQNTIDKIRREAFLNRTSAKIPAALRAAVRNKLIAGGALGLGLGTALGATALHKQRLKARDDAREELKNRYLERMRAMEAASQERSKTASEQIPGGKADEKTDKDFNKKQLLMGEKVELEHTDDRAKAREISRDHLEEFPDYYTRLKKMEHQAEKEMDKKAALDRALGVLYREFGPPQEKTASVNFFFYGINKEERDVEALGQQFCKLAAMSEVDPWEQALSIVQQLPRLEKLASCDDPAIRDLAQFYLTWSDEMIKKAGIFDVGIKGWRAAKAGAGALKSKLPQSSASRMSQAVKADASIAASKAAPAAAKPQGVGEAMKASLKESRGLQQAGGGSIRRGEKLVAKDPGLLNVGKAAPKPAAAAPTGGATQAAQTELVPGARAASTGGVARAPATAAQPAAGTAVTRPAASGSAATVVPGETAAAAGQEAARTGLTRGQMLAGGGLLTGLGLAGGAALSGGGQPQYAGGY